MKLLATIREKDVDSSRENLPDEAYIKFRHAVKFALFDDEGKIAMINHPASGGFPAVGHYFPGGGVDEGEDAITALRREAKEETGCYLDEVKELGQIIEYQNSGGKFRKQIVFVFMAKVLEPKGEPEMTESEKDRNLTVEWLTIDEINNSMKNNLPSIANVRAKVILEEIAKLP